LKKIIVAIDGHAACGKSTTAKQVAKELGYAYIDTGAMYRAVTLYLLNNHIAVEDIETVKDNLQNIEIRFKYNGKTSDSDTWLNGQNVEDDIRTMRVTAKVSEVSAIPEVRHLLVAQQQKMGEMGGVVLDGRDIGTVVFPKAQLKVYMTADMKARALRRQRQLLRSGQDIALEEIARDLAHRDHIDSTREHSPLKKAQDAHVLDTSNLTIPAQVQVIVELARETINMGR
jgi:CMP/dCMP kinase